jgi:DNA-binding NtrC family response regulator
VARILLIDDDADLMEMNRVALVNRGHQVQAAHSAREARQVLATSRPDLVVMDAGMESASTGLELTGEIHRRYPDLPVLGFLDKPMPPAVLADRIDAILAT